MPMVSRERERLVESLNRLAKLATNRRRLTYETQNSGQSVVHHRPLHAQTGR